MKQKTKILPLVISLLLCQNLLFGVAMAIDDAIEDVGISEEVSEVPALEEDMFQTDGKTASGTCGNNVMWTIDTGTGKVTISGTGPMANYSINNNPPWQSYCSFITTVVIDYGVTSIGDDAFHHCESLISITIPNSVTSIGDNAFFFCENLTSVTIPDSVLTIGNSTFSNCKSLTSVSIPDGVTTIGIGAFSLCTSLTTISIPDSVTSIGDYAFGSCTCMTNISVESNNAYYRSQDGVLFTKDMIWLVQYPAGKTGEYSIPDSVITIGDYAFWDCTSLTILSIRNGTTTIGYCAFIGCESLTSVMLPEGIMNIGVSAFSDCKSLANVTIPNSVTTIDDGAFSFCKNLSSITIPSNVTTIGKSAFHGCTCLTDVYYAGTEAQWNCISIGAYNESLTNVTVHYNSTGANPFTDVSSTASYFNAVMWAYNNGIIKGTSATTFSPKADCTRGQFALMLYRLAGTPNVYGVSNPFSDVSPSDSYYKAVLWAYGEGIIKGVSSTSFDPNGSVTRGQIVLMLYRMADKPSVYGSSNPFTDVKSSDPYYQAVLWAKQTGITSGTSATKFSPKSNCTRYQLVTFLYRFNNTYHYI